MSHLFKSSISWRKFGQVCGSKKCYNVLWNRVKSINGVATASMNRELEEEISVSLSWKRPKNVPYPNIWEKFEVKTKDGQTYKFQVEDVTPDRYEEFLDFQFMNFDCREPISKSINFDSDSKSVAARREIRRKLLEQKVSTIITLQDGRSNNNNQKIVAAATIMVISQNDPPIQVTGEKLTCIWDLHRSMKKDINPHQLWNSNIYLTDFGGSIAPEYCTLGLGHHLLHFFSLMGRVWNIPGTMISFTSTRSQRMGGKTGFKVCKEIAYEDYKDENGKPIFPIKDIYRVMIWKFDESQLPKFSSSLPMK